MLSRKSLTHLVRPSAQIFLPSPLRTTSPLPVLVAPCSPSTLSGSLQRPTYATKSKAVPPKRRFKPENKMYKKEVGGFTPETETVLHEFRQACHSPSPAKLMELYPTLRDAKVLTLNDTYHIAHALHFLVRKKRTFDSDKYNLLPFVRQFIDDLKKGALSPTPNAFMHLLTLFRDSRRYNEGYELWKWLADQDDSHVSQGVYGSAIELMAFGGLASLLELEAVYLEGLKRFPGTFAEYHLSPDAIVPDRTRPTYIAGLPMTLLQGILSARILSRDWRNAYLALDTALRLYPTQLPVRYFELFMTERPINEAYTTFLIACRAGIVFKPGHLVNLISKLRSAIVNSSSLHNRIVILRGIANAIYAHLQAGGTLEDTHVSSFIQAFELLLPDKQLQDDNIGDAAELRNMIVVAAHEIMMRLIQAGMSPHASPFVALISLAGKLRVPNLLASTLQDIKTAKLDPGPVGHRNILASAGMLSNTKLIEETWSYISSTAEAEMRQIPYEDWISFVRACRRAHHTEYFEEQYLKFQHAITALIRKRVDAELDTELEARDIKPMKSFTYMEPIAFQLEIEGLKEQFADIRAVVMSGQPLDIGKSPFYMSLDPRRPALSTIENLRAIYDEMTIDPHQPPTQESLEGAAKKANMSSTGLPLDELRFQNWVSILHMMDDAEIYESDYQSEINQAIKEQRRRLEPQVLRMREGHERISIAMKEELRERIKHLRGSSPQT